MEEFLSPGSIAQEITEPKLMDTKPPLGRNGSRISVNIRIDISVRVKCDCLLDQMTVQVVLAENVY